jgi:hypothetical protein
MKMMFNRLNKVQVLTKDNKILNKSWEIHFLFSLEQIKYKIKFNKTNRK